MLGTVVQGGAVPEAFSGAALQPGGAHQGPKKNQIQWTVLDSPGRMATPLFRGKTGRAGVGPSRDQIRLCGFDSRRLHLLIPGGPCLRGNRRPEMREGQWELRHPPSCSTVSTYP